MEKLPGEGSPFSTASRSPAVPTKAPNRAQSNPGGQSKPLPCRMSASVPPPPDGSLGSALGVPQGGRTSTLSSGFTPFCKSPLMGIKLGPAVFPIDCSRGLFLIRTWDKGQSLGLLVMEECARSRTCPTCREWSVMWSLGCTGSLYGISGFGCTVDMQVGNLRQKREGFASNG